MAVSIAYNPGFIALDSNGNPLAGGKVYTYAAGTTTPKATYTDSTGATPNANPVILNSSGYASIWIDGAYKFVIHTSADVLVRTIDNYTNDRGATGAAGTLQVVTAAGTVDAITANYTPDISLTNNVSVGFVSTGANATTTPTFSPDGATARTIVKGGGQALAVGDIGSAGSVHFVTYNLANNRWELSNPIAGGTTSGAWTPSPTLLTVVGTPTYTGAWIRTGNCVFITLRVTATTSTVSSAGSTYFTGLPFTIGSSGSTCTAANTFSGGSLGVGYFLQSNNRLYVPAWSATSEVTVSGFYFV